MGRGILQLLPEAGAMRLTGAVASERSEALGRDAGVVAGGAPLGVSVTGELAPLLADADLVIDFSRGEIVASTLHCCARAGVALLIGTTGWSGELAGEMAEVARGIPLLVAPNTSLAVNVLLELVRTAARALGPEYDVEILEMHHRHKRDAPSGTALALGSAVAEVRGSSLQALRRDAAPGLERVRGSIGFASLRGGEVHGEHEVMFLGAGETLTLSHRSQDRAVFARGALRAGQWLVGKPPGRYTMHDVFFENSKA
jgi:4-hydroxy-tetrahydrodipicolinate reductase